MELEEWEFLPNCSSLESAEDQALLSNELSLFGEVILMDYFICPNKSDSIEFVAASAAVSSELDAITLKSVQDDEGDGDASDHKEFKDISIDPQVAFTSHDPMAQVLFKKIKEDGFDMKVFNCSRDFIMDPIEKSSVESKAIDIEEDEVEEEVKEEKGGMDEFDGLSVWIWKWRVSGVGALCSIGTAAVAAICIVMSVAGQNSHHKHRHHNTNFQLYTDDNKRMKQVVQEASRLKQAFSGARGGVTVTRANISFGGYYDGRL